MIDRLRKLNALFSRRTKVYFWVLVLLMFVGSLLELVGIGAIPVFLSVMAKPKGILEWPVIGRLFRNAGIETTKSIFLVSAWGLVLIYFLKNLYLSCLYYCRTRFVQNRRLELAKRLFTSYMSAPFSFHLHRNSSELLRNTFGEVRILCLEALRPLLQILLNVIMIIAIVTLLLVLQPAVSLIVLGMLGIACVIFLRSIRSKMEKYGREEQIQRKVEFQAISEGINGLKDARILNTVSYFIENYVQNSVKTARALLFKSFSGSLGKPVMEFLAVFGIIVLIILLRGPGSELSSLISTLGLFVVAFLKLQMNLTQLVSSVTLLKYNLYAVDPIYDDIFALEKEFHKIKNHNQAEKELLPFNEKIDINDLTFKYPETKGEVLKDIHMIIPKNGSVGVVGPTGSGKTTLINLILGLLEPNEGRICVDGISIQENIRGWQNKIGYIPQDIYFSDQSIKRNVAFGQYDEEINDALVTHVLEIAQLDRFVFALDKGWDTLIGEHGVRLSGGQRQRIGIARALYHDPEVLVMDEATASLDTTTEKSVMQALNEARQGRTFIMIAHRLSTVKNCDTIYLLKNGRLVSEGSYDHLARHSEIFKQMIADTQ